MNKEFFEGFMWGCVVGASVIGAAAIYAMWGH